MTDPYAYAHGGGTASTLHGNPPGADAYAPVHVLPVYGSNRRTVSVAPSESTSVKMEDCKMGTETIKLPIIIGADESEKDRHRVATKTIRAIDKSGGTNEGKVRLLSQRFSSYTAAERRAEAEMVPFDNLTSAIYSFQHVTIRRDTGTVVPITDPPTDNQRERGMYMCFTLRINPVGHPRLANTNVKPKTVVNAAFQIPQDANNRAVLTTAQQFANPRDAIIAIVAAGGDPPNLIQLTMATAVRLEIDDDRVDSAILDKRYETLFPILGDLYVRAYSGDVQDNAPNELRQVTQRYIDSGGRVVEDVFAKYYKRFNEAMELFTPTTRYPVTLATTCRQGCTEQLRSQIDALNYRDPVIQSPSNTVQEAELAAFALVAVRAEKAITNIRLAAGLAPTAPSGRPTSRSLPAIPMNPALPGAMLPPPPLGLAPPPNGSPYLPAFQFPNSNMMGDDTSTIATAGTMYPMEGPGVIPKPSLAYLAGINYDPSGGEDFQSVHCFVSAAEEAIRKVAGDRIMQCWGCKGPHPWIQCPDRDKPENIANARPYLARFRNPRNLLDTIAPAPAATPAAAGQATPAAAALFDLEKWESMGFPSRPFAESVLVMATVSTDATRRKAESLKVKERYRKAWTQRKRKAGEIEPEAASAAAAAATAQPGTIATITNQQLVQALQQQGQRQLQGQGSVSFLPIVIANAGFQQLKLPPELHVSETLPHIDLVIGQGAQTCFLRTLYDTGAGTNMGRLKYHQEVGKLYPHLVCCGRNIKEDGFSELNVQGIDGQEYGPKVTHTVTYYMPYFIDNNRATITFGLAEDCVADSILGITSIKLQKMVHSAADEVVTSSLYGVSFPVIMQRPTQSLGGPPVPTNTGVQTLTVQETPAPATATSTESASYNPQLMGLPTSSSSWMENLSLVSARGQPTNPSGNRD